MADTKISALTAVASIDGTEEHAVNESGTTKKATGQQQAEYGETRLQQGVKCSHASNQSITASTWTTVAFDTETWKVGETAIHSTVTNNSRLTAQIAGEYLVFGQVEFDTVTSDFTLEVGVRYNGSSNKGYIRVPAISSTDTTTVVNLPTTVVQLSASDYVELRVFHTHSSAIDVRSNFTAFGMYLLGR